MIDIAAQRLQEAFAGALLIVAGVAGQILASRHVPQYLDRRPNVSYLPSTRFGHLAGWTTTVYDVVRIGCWVLLVLGAVTVLCTLAREVRQPARRHV